MNSLNPLRCWPKIIFQLCSIIDIVKWKFIVKCFSKCLWVHLWDASLEDRRIGVENQQGKDVLTNLNQPLWSGYHAAREKDTKTQEHLQGLGAWALAVPLVYSRAWSHVCSPYHVWKFAHILATCLWLKGECGLGELRGEFTCGHNLKSRRPEWQQGQVSKGVSVPAYKRASTGPFSTKWQLIWAFWVLIFLHCHFPNFKEWLFP